MERTLVEQEYAGLGRASRGLVRRYVAKMTGLSRAQVTRLIGQYRDRGEVKAKVYRRHRFARRYQRDDIALLAAVDEAHETLRAKRQFRITDGLMGLSVGGSPKRSNSR